MRTIPRTIIGLALAGSLAVLPVGGILHAAPATHTVATDAPGRAGFVITGAADQSRIAVFMPLENVASLEGVSPDVLQQDLRSGETLLQIGGSRFSSSSDLATALLANLKRKLDLAASSGKFTPAAEAQQYAALLSATETLVVTPHPQVTTDVGKADSGQGVELNLKLSLITAVAANCDTTTAALVSAVQAGGKSILAVCQTTNPGATVDSLAAAVTAAIKAQLDAAVSSGKLPAGQESAMLSDLAAHLPAMLTTPVNSGHGETVKGRI